MITLATLPEATAQQVFDQVATHLLTQNQKSIREEGNCQYRYNNLMCAAGCLISKDEYEENMENVSWNSLIHRHKVPCTHFRLINDLQLLHDKYEPVYWHEKLVEIAIANKFDMSTF